LRSSRKRNWNIIAYFILLALIAILVVEPSIGQTLRYLAVSVFNERFADALNTVASVFGVVAGIVWLWNLSTRWTELPMLDFLTSEPSDKNESDSINEFIAETQQLARNLLTFWNDRQKRMPEIRFGMGLSKEEEEKDQILYGSWVDETSAQYVEIFLEQVMRARRIFREHGIENAELEQHYSRAKKSESVRIIAEELFNMCVDLERRKNLR
jgi:hypothetical protein